MRFRKRDPLEKTVNVRVSYSSKGKAEVEDVTAGF